MNQHSYFDEMKKAHDILMDAFDKSARAHLDSAEKVLAMNRQRIESLGKITSPGDFVTDQTSAVRDYAEQFSAHIQALTTIGNESREQLTELSQEFAKGVDFSMFSPFGETAAKPKTKASGKSS